MRKVPEVDVEDAVPLLELDLEERHGGGDPGDVGEGAHRGQAGCGEGLDGCRDGGLVGDVDLQADDRDEELAAQGFGGLLDALGVDVEEGDRPALTGIPAGGGETDPAGGGGAVTTAVRWPTPVW